LIPGVFSLPGDGTIMDSERERQTDRERDENMKNVKERKIVNK
jgi:hypothetical protein